MTNPRFPFRSLPDNLCLEVLKTMNPHEIIAYSFTSKKALLMVQSLRLPISSVQIRMMARPVIVLQLRDVFIVFELKIRRNFGTMMSMNDFPVKVKVLKGIIEKQQVLKMTNQGRTLGGWIQHLCSLSDRDVLYGAEFHIGTVQLDMQTLRNTFPTLRSIVIYGRGVETSENDTFNAEKLLRAFLPDAQSVELWRIPLSENLSLQHIGTANLKKLEFNSASNLEFDDLSTWNVENCTIWTDQIPLRKLNRFFKLWIKGSNPKLKELFIYCDTEIIPDSKVLLKGLKAKDAEDEESTKFVIQNCHGICAEIKTDDFDETASVVFTVLN